MLRDATADYSDVEMHGVLDVNIPNSARAMMTTNEIVEAIASPNLGIIAAHETFLFNAG
jgi:hypothetical protein